MNDLLPRAPFLVSSLLALSLTGFSRPCEAQERPVLPEETREAVDPKQIVARVGSVEITQEDLAGEYERLIPWNFFHGKVPDEKKQELRIQARDALLEKALIFQDAEAVPITVAEKAIRERFTETLKQSGPQYAKVSDEQYEQLLEQFRARVRRKILIERNEERFEKSLQPVAEADLKARFEEVKEELLTPELASFLMIQLDVDPAQRGALMPVAHLRANEIRAQLLAGEVFEDLARKHSDAVSAAQGGALGFVGKRGFPIPELGPPAFLLADGEISQPIESIHGVHLLRRLESRPRRRLSFDEARPQLLAELEHVQKSAAREAWLGGMRARYPVQILVELK